MEVKVLVLAALLTTAAAERIPTCVQLKQSTEQGWGGWRRHGSPIQDKLLAEAESACGTGDIDCCVSAAMVYRNRVASVADRARARRLLERACEGGIGDACWTLSDIYRNGEGGPVRVDDGVAVSKRAVALVTAACDAGSADGCISLGGIFASGRIAGKSVTDSIGLYQKGLKLLRMSCEGGNGRACLDWVRFTDQMAACNEPQGEECELGLSPHALAPDVKQATEMYKKGCDSGDAGACSELSLRFLMGRGGVQADPRTGVALLRRACDLGFAEGCLFLGWAYEKSKHHVLPQLREAVVKDVAEASSLYDRGCHNGDAFSCYELGSAYLSGRLGLPQDADKGRQLLRRACEDGLQQACEKAAVPQM